MRSPKPAFVLSHSTMSFATMVADPDARRPLDRRGQTSRILAEPYDQHRHWTRRRPSSSCWAQLLVP